jgi:hypothetical protein
LIEVSGVGCPAYALLSYGVASRCQEENIEAETLTLKPGISPSESPPSGRGPGLMLGNWDFIDSTIPLLQSLLAKTKTPKAPQGQLKAVSFGPGFFTEHMSPTIIGT